MSLVELLVVVAILGLLAVTVLPTIASTTESRRTREAARVTSSFIASACTRALGRRQWSGFRVVQVAGTGTALDLTLVEEPPPYRGDLVNTLVDMPVATATTGTLTATVASGSISAAAAAAIARRSPIRFGGRDPWYSVHTISQTTTMDPGTITFFRRDTAGQQNTNTPWPPANQRLEFEIASSPVTLGTAVTLGEGRVIDITWSGYIAPGTGAYVPFAAGDVTVLYDGTGRLRRVVHVGATTDAPGAVFFLVGRADRAGQAFDTNVGGKDDSIGANYQYSDSFWVMINPATGTVHQAACDPTAVEPQAVVKSQSFVRAYLSAGGGS